MTMYTLLVDDGEHSVSCDYLDRKVAIDMAKAKFAGGVSITTRMTALIVSMISGWKGNNP